VKSSPQCGDLYIKKKVKNPVTLVEVSNQTNRPLIVRALKSIPSRLTLTFRSTDRRTFGSHQDYS
jgi:hypothetical protein